MKIQTRQAAVVVSSLFLFSSGPFAQQELAPTVQADLLRDQIYAQAKANDTEAVLASLDQYKKLDIPFPAPLLWIEAKAAHESGDSKRALEALTTYLNGADHKSDQYKEGLALYPKYKADVEASKQLQTDARRQALITRIPEVVAQLNASVIPIFAGRARATERNGAVSFYQRKPEYEFNVKEFGITQRPINQLWWDVFAADSGHVSYDDWKGDLSDADFPAQEIQPEALRDFADWVSKRAGGHWRLPTEAEMLWIAQRLTEGANLPLQALSGSYNHCEPDRGCDDYEIRELVANCWHGQYGSISPQGSAWTTDCELEPNALALLLHSLPGLVFRRPFRPDTSDPFSRFHLARDN
jgi:Sulfatase-modifying factor enzyme 1